ncbi:MAG: S9 family peptidase [Desulfurococcales archaeon]|nr:S9 family peptidase [Desulfurococcales archaeon]
MYDIELLVKRFMAIRSSTSASIAPDGSIYYLSDMTGQMQLWRINKHNGGYVHDLVIPWDRRIGDYTIASNGLIAFSSDFDGDERWAIYVYDGNRIVRVAGEDGSMNILGDWSPDGNMLAFTSNMRNGVDFDVYIYDMRRGGYKRVYEAEGIVIVQSWIGDKLLAVKRNTNLDSDILLVDPNSGKAYNLTQHRGEASNTNPTPINGAMFLYVTNESGEFKSLALYNIEKRKSRVIFNPGWDVELVEYSSGNLYVSVNEDGASALYLLTLDGDEVKVRGVYRQLWVINSIDASGRNVVISASSPLEGNEVYMLRVSLERLTWSPKLGLEKYFTEPESFKYKSFDNLEIHGLLYKPPKPASTPPPAVIWLHGGPESQVRPQFNMLQQALTTLGVAVAAPNFRGSTGYGKTFVHLDDVDKRLDAVRDVYYAVEYLTSKEVIDPDRLCVIGGSYGGYLTLMSLALYPNLWKCGVEIVGIVNLVTFIRNTSPYRRRYRMHEYGDPDKHADIMLKMSPISHVYKIRAPLMVIHGAKDPRVPVSEADQLVNALKNRGVEVEYIRLEDEGHGISKIENRVKVYSRALLFIAKKLLS